MRTRGSAKKRQNENNNDNPSAPTTAERNNVPVESRSYGTPTVRRVSSTSSASSSASAPLFRQDSGVHRGGVPRQSKHEEVRDISVGYRILNLSNIDDQAGTIDAEIMFFFSWIDPALQTENMIAQANLNESNYFRGMKTLTQNQPDWEEVWSPVLLCPNVRESIGVEAVYQPPDRARLVGFTANPKNDPKKDPLSDNIRHGGLGYRLDRPFLVEPVVGRVVLEKRLSYRFGTNFDLRNFPFDGQSLEIVIIELEHPGGIRFVAAPDPFDRHNTISSFAEQNLQNWELHYPTERFDAASAYIANNPAQYTLQINLRRRSTFYIWYVMFPFSIICCSALLGFALPPDSLNDRLPAVIGSIFTAVTFHLSAASSSLPSVPYITYMGSFILTGFIIMFVVAMYYAIVFSCYSGDTQMLIDFYGFRFFVLVLTFYFLYFAYIGMYIRYKNIQDLNDKDRAWKGQSTLKPAEKSTGAFAVVEYLLEGHFRRRRIKEIERGRN